MRAGLERQPRKERWANGGGWGVGGGCEGLRYKQVNDFLLALRLFPHLTAWKGLWRDGLEERPFAQQPSSDTDAPPRAVGHRARPGCWSSGS